MSTMQRMAVANAVMKQTGGKPESVGWLFGPKYREVRRAMMELSTGKRLPLSKCGINALMDELYRLFPVEGDCMTDRERKLGESIEKAYMDSPGCSVSESLHQEGLNRRVGATVLKEGVA